MFVFISRDRDAECFWLTLADCWRIVGHLIPIYLFLLECFLCGALIQICKSRKRLSQVSHRAAGVEQRGNYFCCFGSCPPVSI